MLRCDLYIENYYFKTIVVLCNKIKMMKDFILFLKVQEFLPALKTTDCRENHDFKQLENCKANK